MTGQRSSAPLWVVEGAGKLRNGLYVRALAIYDDRIVFEVFASRPWESKELEDLVLADDVGTTYELALPASGVLEGKAVLEFRPALPAGTSTLHLSQPGWGLHVYGLSERS